MSVRAAVVAFVALIASVRLGAPPVYQQASAPVEARVRDLLSRMTLEEKFWQLFMIPGDLDNPAHDYSNGIFGLQIGDGAAGADAPVRMPRPRRARTPSASTRSSAIFVEKTRLGIPIIPFEEAVHGLARDGATMFPAAIALAATWDTALVGTRRRGDRARDRAPRHPPGALARRQHRRRRAVGASRGDVRRGSVSRRRRWRRAFVEAFEQAGVVTTPKHFVANVGEGGRDSYPIEIQRARRSSSATFRRSSRRSQAGARSVMTAYNSVDGLPATQNRHLLTDVLKGEWGFKGVRHF